MRVPPTETATRVRRAALTDCALIWQWANEPVARAQSFCCAPIPWMTHVRWFESLMSEPEKAQYIAEYNCCPVAQVRFESQDETAVVSISVDHQFRGLGIGRRVLADAIAAFESSSGARSITAYIRPGNSASIKLFAKLGFEVREPTPWKDQVAVKMELALEAFKDRRVA